MNWLELVIGLIGGGGITTVIVAVINKRKSPYDLYTEFIQTQREWMETTKGELDKEKRDSAEKSYVIARTRLCQAKRENPSLTCPVDEANDERLKSKCETCIENRQSKS